MGGVGVDDTVTAVEGEGKTHAADAGYAISPFRGLLEHNVGFVLTEVEQWFLRC